ncbi:MAG TPA: RNA polymerase sigma factor [Blastocatellia bacterium]|nr:RNA polymerase sigma factor [Blastocatellia bacterium]
MKERIPEKPQANVAAYAAAASSISIGSAGPGEIEMTAEISAETSIKMGEMTDDELVVAARGGDESAFNLLFERHRRLVSRLGYRFFPRRDQVEEIIQESFIKAYFALADYQGGGEKSFVSWLARIAVRTCYDELRRTRRRGESSIGDLSEDEAAYLHERLRDLSASGNVEGAAISRDLANKLLSRLRPDDRMVLALLKLEELSIAEISNLTGWTTAKVKMRSHRAQRGLRQLLGKLL